MHMFLLLIYDALSIYQITKDDNIIMYNRILQNQFDKASIWSHLQIVKVLIDRLILLLCDLECSMINKTAKYCK